MNILCQAIANCSILISVVSIVISLYSSDSRERKLEEGQRKLEEERAKHWESLELQRAKLRESMASNMGDHPKQNLVKGRRTAKDYSRSRCEYLSEKHEECAKLRRSDEPRCKAYKNILQIDCATWDGVSQSSD